MAGLSQELNNALRMPVFDGHNDVLTQLQNAGGLSNAQQFLNSTDFHIDCVKAAQGGFCGGFFAMWVASQSIGDIESLMVQDSYDIPLPPAVKQADALNVVMEQAAILLKLQSLGAVTLCKTVEDIRTTAKAGGIAAILHLEGCEAIDADFSALDVLYAAGLRSLGPVWSRKNVYGSGVPFSYPSSPDVGAGLSEAGVELVRHCNAKRIVIDLSHINLAGFLDVAKHSDAPLIATHSNVHSLCPHARNLTEEQLETIAASSGLVGLNFATAFLRQDGRMLEDVPLSQMIRHIDALMDSLGEDGVALGSDFDGAVVPAAIENCAGVQVLVDAMLNHGYGESLVQKICFENWMGVLERTW